MGKEKPLIDNLPGIYETDPHYPVPAQSRRSSPVRPRGLGGRGRGFDQLSYGFRHRKTAAIALAGVLLAGAYWNKDKVADTFGACPAGREWSSLGPLPLEASPECKVGLPRPLKSGIEWPVGDTTVSGVAEYQVTGVAEVTNPADNKSYPGIVVDFKLDAEKVAEVFADPSKIKTFNDYTVYAAEYAGPDKCAEDMGRIIGWGQAGVDGLTADEEYRKKVREGESHYAITGNGGAATDSPAPNILVVIPDPSQTPADGKQGFEIISCLDRVG
ncbi:MAG TPA: hypothetical protein VK674_07630 [Candidatus Limnocylindria bacterium]|nr:hypothetical protein [Candidatus Limnocylindria bacterium]